MIDSDVAEFYQVTTGNLNLALRRNKTGVRCFALANCKSKTRPWRPTDPYAFTELGVAMLSSVLNSDRAVQMNLNIMRAFVRLSEALANESLARRIDEVVAAQQEHAVALVGVISEIKRPKAPRRRKLRIGCYTDEKSVQCAHSTPQSKSTT